MAVKENQAAVAVFATLDKANRAVEDLLRVGFYKEQIGVVSRSVETEDTGVTIIEKDQKVPQGAAVGAATGAGVGALWAIGIATLGLPALGPVIAGGLFMSILASVAGGAAVGGFVGALVGFGIPEEDARHYEAAFQAGRTLVIVQAEDRYDDAAHILRDNGGYLRNAATVAAPNSTSLP
jgi:hypothetical protein